MSRHSKACVIGWPIAHSRSPLIHRYWLDRYGIEGDYTKEAVKPEELEAFLGTMARRGLAGCNVTVPHKEAAYRAAVRRDAAADAVAAANTLWLERDVLCASNTDTAGFMEHLRSSSPDWDKRRRPATVLGAGGAARAIVFGLMEAGAVEIRVCNRTRKRTDELVRHFGGQVMPIEWNERERALQGCGLLVNATSLGMSGGEPLEIDLTALTEGATVADIVYAPLETELLRRARRRGLLVVDGLGMLLHQAVPGFEKWFGQRPEVTAELRALVAADIEGQL
ncbi:MAG: shikimate dehydrogenase [Pseudomonadota bacterium]|nr:shikimate dehydrogenase [Pseudomonadota bacterium]